MPRFYIRHERQPRAERKFRVYSPWWVDPYFWILGSSIEKMMMAELARRGVFFIFQSQTNDLGGLVDPTWEADFLLPQHKIWMEIQGSYFHSLPGQIEKDSLRFAAITMAGWTPIFVWEFDIRNRLNDLLDEIGVFYNVDHQAETQAKIDWGKRYGSVIYDERGAPNFGIGSDLELDHLAGLRKALAARAKPIQLAKRYARARRPK